MISQCSFYISLFHVVLMVSPLKSGRMVGPVRGKRKRNRKLPWLAVSRKEVPPESSQVNSKMSTKARRRKARKKLKAQEREVISQWEVSVEDGSKSTAAAEVGKVGDLKTEKGGPSFDRSSEKNVRNDIEKRVPLFDGSNKRKDPNDAEKREPPIDRSNKRKDPNDTEKSEPLFDRSEKKKKKKKKRKEKMVDHGTKSEGNVGGLIFICNSKTKPDCFRYKIMAVSAGKKEVVLGIKPGVKLFLYDYDLKLLYGIYEASSAGGIILERAAFGGAFPAQVRFRIYEDCLPLPESVFKKAIKENYDERTNKFRTELTSKQVTKLKSLFRPFQSQKDHQAVQQPSSSSDPLRVADNEVHSHSVQPSLHAPRQDPLLYAPDPESYKGSQYVDQIFPSTSSIYRDIPSAKEQIFRDPAQTYMATPSQVNFGQPLHRYGSSSSLGFQPGCSEPSFPPEHAYPMYGLRSQSQTNTSYEIPVARAQELDHYTENRYLPSNYNGTLSDPYLRLPGRGTAYEVYSQTTLTTTTAHSTDMNPGVSATDYSLPIRGATEGMYSFTPSHELSYNQRNHHIGGLADNAPAPVSSRYSFAGASYSLR